MDAKQLKKLHRVMFLLWIVPGIPISTILVLYGSVKLVLVLNVVMSAYTIIMEHLIAWKQEEEA